jgi:hypothetical protein
MGLLAYVLFPSESASRNISDTIASMERKEHSYASLNGSGILASTLLISAGPKPV